MKNKINQPIPIGEENRIVYLDILRGIAIFCIFSANIVWFSGYYDFPTEGILPWASFSFDNSFSMAMQTLLDGKFYSIFSLLFGIGCAIQYDSMVKNSKPFAPFFRRRMLWLLLIGSIHLVFLWDGDILTLYALLGLVLIWFVKLSSARLLRWAAVLISLPIVNWIVINSIGWDYPSYFYGLNVQYNQNLGLSTYEWQGIQMTDYSAYVSNQNLADFFRYNFGNTLNRLAGILAEGRAFKVLGIFLLGLWAGRKILHDNLLDNSSLLNRLAAWGIGIGLPISIARTWISNFSNHDNFWSLMETLSYALGTVPLAIGIAAFIALLHKKEVGFLKVFAPVGKMALSNYLFQTFLATSLFYGIGFGLGGKLGYTLIIGIVVLIFSFQIVFSKWWLKNHKFGPMEWIWRQLTYGKRIKNRK